MSSVLGGGSITRGGVYRKNVPKPKKFSALRNFSFKLKGKRLQNSMSQKKSRHSDDPHFWGLSSICFTFLILLEGFCVFLEFARFSNSAYPRVRARTKLKLTMKGLSLKRFSIVQPYFHPYFHVLHFPHLFLLHLLANSSQGLCFSIFILICLGFATPLTTRVCA